MHISRRDRNFCITPGTDLGDFFIGHFQLKGIAQEQEIFQLSDLLLQHREFPDDYQPVPQPTILERAAEGQQLCEVCFRPLRCRHCAKASPAPDKVLTTSMVFSQGLNRSLDLSISRRKRSLATQAAESESPTNASIVVCSPLNVPKRSSFSRRLSESLAKYKNSGSGSGSFSSPAVPWQVISP